MTTRYTFSDYCQLEGSGWGYVDDPTGYAALYLGDLHRDERGSLYEIEYCSGSDYSGGSVTAANFRAIKRDFAEVMEKGIWEYYGGHGTYGLVYDPTRLDPETLERLEEVIRGLEDYPVIDEELWSEVEMEAQEEAWVNWVSWEVEHRLDKLFGDNGYIFEYDNDAADAFYSFFSFMEQKHNCEWINETGNSMYIDIERALPTFEVVYEAMFGEWYEQWEKWNDNAPNPFVDMVKAAEELGFAVEKK